MSFLHVERIGQKIAELYTGLINMDDCTGRPFQEQEQAFKSRAIAAYTVFMFTGASPETCANAITDGFNDMGIDAVYNDLESKTLYFVQSKWITDGNGSPAQGDILKFISGVKRTIRLDFDSSNKKLFSKKPDVELALLDSDYKIHLLIAYTGSQNLSSDVKRDLEDLMKEMNDTSEVIEYTHINQSRIYNSITMGAEASPINLDDIDLREWGRIGGPYLAYYGLMSASIVGEWWKEYGNRLFAKNIRFFKGASDANEGMLKTLSQDPSDFCYFNNGIKILCDRLTKKPIYGDDRQVGLFTAHGVSIVNGAQTVGCIGTVYQTNPEKVASAKVFVQFISLENAPENYGTQITRLSNTQNRIEGRDFAALDSEQDRIRKDLWMDGITYFYKGNISNRLSDTEISIDEAVTGLACFNSDIKWSTLAKRNFGAFFEDIQKSPYIDFFNNQTNSALIVNTVRAVRYIDSVLEQKKRIFSGRESQVLVHGNRFITYMAMSLQPKRNLYNSACNFQLLKEGLDLVLDKVMQNSIAGIESLFPDNYLNSLFKNNQKCTDLCAFVKKNC